MVQRGSLKELVEQGYRISNNSVIWCTTFWGAMFGFMCLDAFLRRYVLVPIDFIFCIFFWLFVRHFKKRREYWEFRRIEENFKVKED
jgi:hypothetical protein